MDRKIQDLTNKFWVESFLAKDGEPKATWGGVIAKTLLFLAIVLLGFIFEANTHFMYKLGFIGWIALMALQIFLVIKVVKDVKNGYYGTFKFIIFLLIGFLGIYTAYSIEIGLFYLAAWTDISNAQIIAMLYPLLMVALFITIILVSISILWSKSVKFSPSILMAIIWAFIGFGIAWLVAWILSIFGLTSLYYLLITLTFGGSILSIAIIILVIVALMYILALVIAAFKQLIMLGVKKKLEWYFAYRITILVVEIYIKVVRLLINLVIRQG